MISQASEPWPEQPLGRVCSQPAVRGGAPGGQQQQRGGQGESQVLQQARAARSVTALQSPLASSLQSSKPYESEVAPS